MIHFDHGHEEYLFWRVFKSIKSIMTVILLFCVSRSGSSTRHFGSISSDLLACVSWYQLIVADSQWLRKTMELIQTKEPLSLTIFQHSSDWDCMRPAKHNYMYLKRSTLILYTGRGVSQWLVFMSNNDWPSAPWSSFRMNLDSFLTFIPYDEFWFDYFLTFFF